ncbi:MadS family sensor histidine kinase [Luteipulveratus halotolerans]|uniref:MadS family sensor histidine kinase n=1 Tax=Luteipulveratus halotolerans TaxID=1631356 RepID=UPI0008FC1159|nr:histidine kinase [Luteipulveratus halotolerans]
MNERRPDLAALTGVRSGKRSYYREYRRSDERLQRAVHALDSISQALVRTAEGPRGLLEQVARAACAHLDADWTVLGLADGRLTGARPRFVAVDGDAGVVQDEAELPASIRRELGIIRAGHALSAVDDTGWVRVAMTLDGTTVGRLVARHRLSADPEPGDLTVLRILANQAAVALHTSEQFQAGLALHRRAQQLNDETAIQARDLAERTASLRQAERRLVVANQHRVVDAERHRIARELHDTVSQQVLSVGMAVELARGEAAALGAGAQSVVDGLGRAKDLSQHAVEQLRRAIYALHQDDEDALRTLPELLEQVARQHQQTLDVRLVVEGDVIELPEGAGHEVTRAVGEALFNVAMHAVATRAVVRLRYRPEAITVTVADDGRGDPRRVRQMLRLAAAADGDGRHRGLVSMQRRIADLGGSIALRRARLGGLRVEMRLPLPIVGHGDGVLIDHLVRREPTGRRTDHADRVEA